jgi:hypothetical protein
MGAPAGFALERLKTIHGRQRPLLFLRRSHLPQLTLYSCGKGDLIQSLPSVPTLIDLRDRLPSSVVS